MHVNLMFSLNLKEFVNVPLVGRSTIETPIYGFAKNLPDVEFTHVTSNMVFLGVPFEVKDESFNYEHE